MEVVSFEKMTEAEVLRGFCAEDHLQGLGEGKLVVLSKHEELHYARMVVRQYVRVFGSVDGGRNVSRTTRIADATKAQIKAYIPSCRVRMHGGAGQVGVG